jgi:hypothetical protein
MTTDALDQHIDLLVQAVQVLASDVQFASRLSEAETHSSPAELTFGPHAH